MRTRASRNPAPAPIPQPSARASTLRSRRLSPRSSEESDSQNSLTLSTLSTMKRNREDDSDGELKSLKTPPIRRRAKRPKVSKEADSTEDQATEDSQASEAFQVTEDSQTSEDTEAAQDKEAPLPVVNSILGGDSPTPVQKSASRQDSSKVDSAPPAPKEKIFLAPVQMATPDSSRSSTETPVSQSIPDSQESQLAPKSLKRIRFTAGMGSEDPVGWKEGENLLYKSPPSNMLTRLLPTEILQQVMLSLDRDRDIVNFALATKRTEQCMSQSIWAKRWPEVFDIHFIKERDGETPSEFRQRRLQEMDFDYKVRMALAKSDTRFGAWSYHAVEMQRHCLSQLKLMVLESDAKLVKAATGAREQVVGLNQQWLENYFLSQATDLLHHVVENTRGSSFTTAHCRIRESDKATRKLELMMKLCLLHISLNPALPPQIRSFIESQKEVYLSRTKRPIFKGALGQTIDFNWLHHVANFFKFHLKVPNGEGILTHFYTGLPAHELPRAWPGKLEQGTKKLGRKWKGAFTYIDEDELALLRSGKLNNTADDETTELNNGFQDLFIFNDIAPTAERDLHQLQFPGLYEDELEPNPRGAYKEGDDEVLPTTHDFFGLVTAETSYHLHGRVHALPPQSGIPGWQRVTMMKEMPSEDGDYGTGHSNQWAYEGVVLPGGQVMIGRWWRPFDPEDAPSYSGPFIFWQVPATEAEKENVQEALDFMEDVAANTAG